MNGPAAASGPSPFEMAASPPPQHDGRQLGARVELGLRNST